MNKAKFNKSLITILIASFASLALFYFPTHYMPTLNHDLASNNEIALITLTLLGIVSAVGYFIYKSVFLKQDVTDKEHNLIRNIAYLTLMFSIMIPSLALCILATFPNSLTATGMEQIYISGISVLYTFIFVAIIAAFIFSKKSEETNNKASYGIKVVSLLGTGLFLAVILIGDFGALLFGVSIAEVGATFTWTAIDANGPLPGSDLAWSPVPAITPSVILGPIYGTGIGGTVLGNWQAILLFTNWLLFVVLLATLATFIILGKIKAPESDKADKLTLAGVVVTITFFVIYFVNSSMEAYHGVGVVAMSVDGSTIPTAPTNIPTTIGETVSSSMTYQLAVKGSQAYFATMFSVAIAGLIFPILVLNNELMHALKH